jgi:aminomethyltransferase
MELWKDRSCGAEGVITNSLRYTGQRPTLTLVSVYFFIVYHHPTGGIGMSEGKKTPLYDTHVAYGGRIVEFGGWLLPVQYSGIRDEHHAVRTKAGLFDVSHMGEVRVEGPGALDFLQKLVANNVARLVDQQILYTPMCYENGGVVDDLLVYKYADSQYLLVINAANIDKDWQWMVQSSKGFDVKLTNISPQTAQLALQGPLAQKILSGLTDVPLDQIKYYWFQPQAVVAGKPVMISRTGYTGEDGFEIYCQPEDAPYLWEQLMQAGKPLGLIPAGLGARDTLRFEACLPLYGHELSADITPLEAGISMFVKLDKDGFTGQAALATQKQAGLKRKIMGLEMVGRGVARAQYPIFAGEQQIGFITTGSYAPTLNKNMGLAMIDIAYAKLEQPVEIEIRGKKIAAKLIKKPFYKREGK